MKPEVLAILLFALLLVACSDEENVTGSSEFSAAKEAKIRKYNLEIEKGKRKSNEKCDTLALEEFILSYYPAGTHLMKINKKNIYDVPSKAVIYYKEPCNRQQYILACIVKSKECARLIEPNNLIGYESSFIDFDSTKLGTALFYLTLFECYENESFNIVWEKYIPSEGGFNSIKLKRWKQKNMLYVQINFLDGVISGNRNYNYFFIDNIQNEPHLLETYEGIEHRRTLAYINDDIFPDYFEYRFQHSNNSSQVRDSIPFYWNNNKQLYVTNINKNWFRKY